MSTSSRMPKSQRQRMSNGEILILFVQNHIQTIAVLFASVFVVLWLYPEYPITSFLNGLQSISLYTIAKQESMVIAVGWNTNVDLIVNGIQVMNDMSKKQQVIVAKDHAVIQNKEELLQTFAFWFEKSAAAERHVNNVELFDELLRLSKSQATAHYSAGGNAALMANQLAHEQHMVILGGPIGNTLKELIHENITLPNTEDMTDEIHLILEYSKLAEFNGKAATRSNRFILTRDISNSKLSGMESLHQHCMDHPPRALVTSGFHLLNDQTPAIRKERLALANKYFKQLNQSIPIHLEFASMSDSAVIKQVAEDMFSRVNSIGINEQELLSVYTALGGKMDKSMETLAALIPSPQAVADALRFIIDFFAKKKSELQRIHFHSFAFHMIAQVRENKGQTMFFQNAKAAVAHGSLVATLRACNTTMDDFQESDAEILAPLYFRVTTPSGTHDMEVDAVYPVAQWDYPIQKSYTIRFHYSPVVVCKQPKQTVGLGDSISAAGLAYSLHDHVLDEE